MIDVSPKEHGAPLSGLGACRLCAAHAICDAVPKSRSGMLAWFGTSMTLGVGPVAVLRHSDSTAELLFAGLALAATVVAFFIRVGLARGADVQL